MVSLEVAMELQLARIRQQLVRAVAPASGWRKRRVRPDARRAESNIERERRRQRSVFMQKADRRHALGLCVKCGRRNPDAVKVCVRCRQRRKDLHAARLAAYTLKEDCHEGPGCRQLRAR